MESIQTYTQTEIRANIGTIQAKLKELSIDFEGKGEVRGYYFKQLFKSDTAYMYIKQQGGSVSYEVFKRIVNRQFKCISYPSSKQFGLTAWDYADYNKALKKFNELSE